MLTPHRNESMLEYWISLWPTAPLFGVRWRFEKLTGAPSFFQPMDVFSQVAQASARAAQTIDADVAPHVAAAASSAAKDVVEDAVEIAENSAELIETRPQTLYSERPDNADSLCSIKGVGPKIEAMLNEMGIYRFEQISKLSDAELAWLDTQLDGFKGRATRDDWIGQAKRLMS